MGNIINKRNCKKKKNILNISHDDIIKLQSFYKQLINGILIPSYVIKEPLLPLSYIRYKNILFYLDKNVNQMVIKFSTILKYYEIEKIYLIHDIHNHSCIKIYVESQKYDEYHLIGSFVMFDKESRNNLLRDWHFFLNCLKYIDIDDIDDMNADISYIHLHHNMNKKQHTKYLEL